MYIPTYDTLISKLESILRYIHVIHFWKWETISDMTVKSQMINSRKIFAVCCDGILVYVWYIISLQTPPSEVIVNDTLDG